VRPAKRCGRGFGSALPPDRAARGWRSTFSLSRSQVESPKTRRLPATPSLRLGRVPAFRPHAGKEPHPPPQAASAPGGRHCAPPDRCDRDTPPADEPPKGHTGRRDRRFQLGRPRHSSLDRPAAKAPSLRADAGGTLPVKRESWRRTPLQEIHPPGQSRRTHPSEARPAENTQRWPRPARLRSGSTAAGVSRRGPRR
jgi:hypothetical protein